MGEQNRGGPEQGPETIQVFLRDRDHVLDSLLFDALGLRRAPHTSHLTRDVEPASQHFELFLEPGPACREVRHAPSDPRVLDERDDERALDPAGRHT